MISYNNALVDHNNLLIEKLEEVQKVLTYASVIYVDSHAIKLEIFTNPTKHGKLLFQAMVKFKNLYFFYDSKKYSENVIVHV